MNSAPYRVFQILPAPLEGRVYLVVDGVGDPAIALQKVLFHLASPKSSDPFRLEPCASPSSSLQSSSSPGFSTDVEPAQSQGLYHGLGEVGDDPTPHRPPSPPSIQK